MNRHRQQVGDQPVMRHPVEMGGGEGGRGQPRHKAELTKTGHGTGRAHLADPLRLDPAHRARTPATSAVVAAKDILEPRPGQARPGQRGQNESAAAIGDPPRKGRARRSSNHAPSITRTIDEGRSVATAPPDNARLALCPGARRRDQGPLTSLTRAGRNARAHQGASPRPAPQEKTVPTSNPMCSPKSPADAAQVRHPQGLFQHGSRESRPVAVMSAAATPGVSSASPIAPSDRGRAAGGTSAAPPRPPRPGDSIMWACGYTRPRTNVGIEPGHGAGGKSEPAPVPRGPAAATVARSGHDHGPVQATTWRPVAMDETQLRGRGPVRRPDPPAPPGQGSPAFLGVRWSRNSVDSRAIGPSTGPLIAERQHRFPRLLARTAAGQASAIRRQAGPPVPDTAPGANSPAPDARKPGRDKCVRA